MIPAAARRAHRGRAVFPGAPSSRKRHLPGSAIFPEAPSSRERGLPARVGPQARHGRRGQDARAPGKTAAPTRASCAIRIQDANAGYTFRREREHSAHLSARAANAESVLPHWSLTGASPESTPILRSRGTRELEPRRPDLRSRGARELEPRRPAVPVRECPPAGAGAYCRLARAPSGKPSNVHPREACSLTSMWALSAPSPKSS